MCPPRTQIGEGAGSPRPLPHHRTCGPASGGSSSRLIETLPGLADGLQAEAVPVGIGQGHLKDLGARNPPVPLAATRLFRALVVPPLAGGAAYLWAVLVGRRGRSA